MPRSYIFSVVCGVKVFGVLDIDVFCHGLMLMQANLVNA